MRFLYFVFVIGCLASMVFTAASVLAGTQINNVVIEVDTSGRASTEIVNIGDTPMGYVLTPYEWTVEEGENSYRETKQFIAVPPSFQLAPGEKKTVRVGFRNPSPSKFERTFRLSVREVPSKTGEEGLAFIYNHMLPVYIAPIGGSTPTKISWSLVGHSGSLSVRAFNQGNTRAVIKRLVANNLDVPTSSRATILAQSWRDYQLPVEAVSGGSVSLKYELTSGYEGTITVNK